MNIEIKFENGRIVPYLGPQEITMEVSPFLIFLATAGMCSAVYVQAFMSQRGMSLDGVKIIQKMNYNQFTNHVNDIDINIDLPASFPEKYKKAIINVVDQCPVKQHLLEPPTFNVVPNIAKEESKVA
ncbi:MAG: OsmC family protein [Bacteroidota bacterium]